MKKIFQLSMIGVLSFCVSCGDSSDGEASATDTSAASTDTMPAPPANPVVTKSITLSSSQEVPANDSKGTGTADVTYNKETKMLTYTVNYSGLTGDAAMAHIHGTAAKGVNAGVAQDLTPKLKKSTSGNFSDTVQVGQKINEDSLLLGLYYFNIHTKKNPGGEIRGQIEF